MNPNLFAPQIPPLISPAAMSLAGEESFDHEAVFEYFTQIPP
jgi:hypothetical protein